MSISQQKNYCKKYLVEESGFEPLVLIRVRADGQTRAEVLRVIDIFRGKVVDVSPSTYTLEITGQESKINAVLDILRPLGIKEVIRTEKIASKRTPKK